RAEPDDRRQEVGAVLVGSAGVDACGNAEALQCARRVERAAADARRLAWKQVAREVADERDHALASMGLLASTRASAASANAAAKLGSDAPPQGSACGWARATTCVHQPGPCG